MLPLNLYLVTYLPCLFWFSFLFYPFYFAPIMYPYIFFRIPFGYSPSTILTFCLPNFSGVDFVPHATPFSFQMDSPFLPKLTSRLHYFFFFPLHHHPRRKHPNSSSPSGSWVPNIGCPGPSILFICPFVLCWEIVVDWSPLLFQFSGYRQHCAVPDLSLLSIPFHSFPFDLIEHLDYFVGPCRLNH
jgi:hypothetical protein